MRNTLSEAYSRNHITDPASRVDDAINLLEETISAVELEQREIVRGLTTARNDIADLRSARDILIQLKNEPST